MKPVRRAELYCLKDNGTAKGNGRPVVVVSIDLLNRGNSVTIVPFYSQRFDDRKNLDYCAAFYTGEGGLDRDCVAKADEVARIDKLEINLAKGSIGVFNESQMRRLEEAIRWSLGL